jgi:hypothetical protein
MGYNIEFSFNILKNSSITKILEEIKECAKVCQCEDFYEEYEFENKVQFQRRHCLITVKFSQSNIHNMIEFLIQMKKMSGIYIELIYDEDNHSILFASQYFITQKMDKYAAKNFKIQKRKRSYSDDETMILNIVSK